MKKAVFLWILLQSCVFYLNAQEHIYSVTAELEGNRTSIDSILLENITNGTRIRFDNLPLQTIYNIDLGQQVITSLMTVAADRDNFYIHSNASGNLTVGNHLASPGQVKVSVYLLNGQKVFESTGISVHPGELISVGIGLRGVCLVSFVSSSGIQTFKAVGKEGSGLVNVSTVSGTAAIAGIKKGSASLADDFSFAPGDSLRVSVYKETYYARPVSFRIAGSRNLDFSLSLSTVTQAGVSDGYVALDGQTTEVKSFDESTGVVQVNFTGEKPQLLVGDVITVDVDTMGYLRKIVEVIEVNDTITLVTEQAYMNDIFVNKAFKLHTGLTDPGVQLKSTASAADISEALTDENGYIHPVEVIYHGKDGKLVTKSALGLKSAADYVYPIVDYYRDLAMDLHGAAGDDVRLYISEGNITMTSDAVFDFDFKEDVVLTEDTKVKKGDLNMFSYYLDAEAGFKAKLNLDMNKSAQKEDTKRLVDFETVTAKFFVGSIPVWITFDMDIFGNYSFSADASLNADWGFESKHKLEVGGIYHRATDSFEPIKRYTPVNTVFPLNIEGEINAYARTEIYPRAEIKFYGFYGPYAEIVPYIKGNYNARLHSQITPSGSQTFLAWDSGIDLGLDLRVGTELTFLGLFPVEFGPTIIPCFETRLWQSPVDINLISTLPQESEINSEIILKFKVTDLAGNPVGLVPIYVEGNGSFSKHILMTNMYGEASETWNVGGTAGKKEFSATIHKSDRSVIKKITYSTDVKEDNTVVAGTFTDSRDGNVYDWVKIGDQTWMAENLAYLPSVNFSSQGSTTEPRYYVYFFESTNVAPAKETENYKKYGVLYNWVAALQACPSGWHLASDAEWSKLANHIGGRNIAGGKLKDASSNHWLSPNTGATDEYGFNALPGGYRRHDGAFGYDVHYGTIGTGGHWWSSTIVGPGSPDAWGEFMYFDKATMPNYGHNKGAGYSVRCIKD